MFDGVGEINVQDNVYLAEEKKCNCSVLIAEPLRSELIDTVVLNDVAPGPVQYRGSVPIPSLCNFCFSNCDTFKTYLYL